MILVEAVMREILGVSIQGNHVSTSLGGRSSSSSHAHVRPLPRRRLCCCVKGPGMLLARRMKRSSNHISAGTPVKGELGGWGYADARTRRKVWVMENREYHPILDGVNSSCVLGGVLSRDRVLDQNS